MAKSDSKSSDSGNWTSPVSTSGGFGGTNQSLSDGLNYDADGNAVIPEIQVPDGAEIVKTHQMGAFRRTVFSNGAVETVQTEPANQSGNALGTVVLPGEQHDVTGTGQDAATKPKKP